MNELIFSAPGRVELGGNHTDHQRGCVLAAAIDRTTRARVRLTRSPVVRVFSRGYDPVTLPLDQLSPREPLPLFPLIVRYASLIFSSLAIRPIRL